MDKVLQTGTQKIFSQLAQNALKGLRYEYRITAAIPESTEQVGPLRQAADCFVLLTNLLDQL